MLEIAVLRNNPDFVKERLAVKNFKQLELVDEVLKTDENRRSVQKQLDDNLAKQNVLAKEIGDLFKQGKKEEAEGKKSETAVLKEESKKLEADLNAAEEQMKNILVLLPNLPNARVPKGHSPEENEVVKQVGEIPALSEKAMPHWDLAAKHGLFDLELGVKITGAGFPVYKKYGVLS